MDEPIGAYKQRISDECNIAVFAQVYLDQQRRKQRAVPKANRDKKWHKRTEQLDEVQAGIDRILGIE